jgi:predicted regulator of Ras-like GTPase activity (Roadblock/LC7/MglB family)
MSFQKILQPLVYDIENAIGAIFVDGDGEAVEHLSRDPDCNIKLLGAYKGIIMNNMREIAKRLELGDVKEMVVSFDNAELILSPVAEGYFLLLFLQPHSNIGKGMIRLRDAIKEIRKEL